MDRNKLTEQNKWIWYGKLHKTDLETLGWEYKDSGKMTKDRFLLEGYIFMRNRGAYYESEATLSIRRGVGTYEIIYKGFDLTEKTLQKLTNKYKTTKMEQTAKLENVADAKTFKTTLNNGWKLCIDWIDPQTDDFKANYIIKDQLTVLLNHVKQYVDSFGVPNKGITFFDPFGDGSTVKEVAVFMEDKEIQVYFD